MDWEEARDLVGMLLGGLLALVAGCVMLGAVIAALFFLYGAAVGGLIAGAWWVFRAVAG